MTDWTKQDFDWTPPENIDPVDIGDLFISGSVIPIDFKPARFGVKYVQQQYTAAGDIEAIVHIRRGLFGWFTRRWLRDHPWQYTAHMFRPEWGEWREVSGTIRMAKPLR